MLQSYDALPYTELTSVINLTTLWTELQLNVWRPFFPMKEEEDVERVETVAELKDEYCKLL